MTNELAGKEVDRSNLLADRGAIVEDMRNQYAAKKAEKKKNHPEILKSSLPQMSLCPF